MHRFLRIFIISGRAPQETVVDCGFVIFFFSLWRREIQLHSNLTVNINFISSQTYHDLISACSAVVVAVKQMRHRCPNVCFEIGRCDDIYAYIQAISQMLYSPETSCGGCMDHKHLPRQLLSANAHLDFLKNASHSWPSFRPAGF